MASVETSECLDFLQFQETLKKMRESDDKIVYTLNVNLPTESFKDQSNSRAACKQLYDTLQTNFIKRRETIEKCINYTKQRVLELKNLRDQKGEDSNIIKQLRKEQSKLKLLRTELGVEEVVTEKTSKVLYERCRTHYVPPNFNY